MPNLGLQDWNTRQCNADAIFQNVLTMTGQSPDLNNPSFLYDQTGLECLDTIQVRQLLYPISYLLSPISYLLPGHDSGTVVVDVLLAVGADISRAFSKVVRVSGTQRLYLYGTEVVMGFSSHSTGHNHRRGS